MKRNDLEYGKKVWKELEQIILHGYQISNVYEDFIEIALTSILSFCDNLRRSTPEDFQNKIQNNHLDGVYEDRYMAIVGRYKENKSRQQGQRPADFFKRAWILAQKETNETGKDVLGHIFETFLANDSSGQFFTPMAVARMIARLVNNDTDDAAKKDAHGITVHEPACGSGHMIIAHNELYEHARYTGIEVSPLVARICTLNMWLFDIHADIYNGNTLSMEMSQLWQIRPGGYLYEYEIKGDHMFSTATPTAEKVVREQSQAYAA